ncbi:MAG TPA: hypothetical protein VF624_15020 [Tepidisphaeraceae bacterium]|jgi:phage FluMu gp28-like protein
MGNITDIIAGMAAAAAATVGPMAAPAVETRPAPASVVRFDPSQRRLMDDESRVIVVVWHRQKGKDFTAANKAIRHAMRTHQTWYIVSLTQRQADATFAKCRDAVKQFAEFVGKLIDFDEGSFESRQFDKELKQGFTFLAREIRLPGGGRVVSLPGRDPDTLAGLTGNVIFTEFGLFPNGGYDHWRVVFPLTTRGFQCIVISTPRGKQTKFYELFANDARAYSVHFCDIHRSIAEDGFVLRNNDGEPTDIDTFKRLYGDAAGFEREYECKFSGDAMALVTWAEIERAASLVSTHGRFRYVRLDDKRDGDRLPITADLLGGERLAVGWDVARTGDISAVACNVVRANQPAHLALVVAMRNCEFAYMRGVVVNVMSLSRQSAGFGDATGLGMESNETLAKRFPGRWTPHTFSAKGKLEVASAIKTAFNDATQTLPPLDGPHKLVATDVYALQRDASSERVVISETVNPLLEESHCDIAFALGLARLAGAAAKPMGHITHSGRKPAGC